MTDPSATPETIFHQRLKAWVRRAMLVIALAGLVFAFRRPLLQNNFGVVDPGKVYRSAQLLGPNAFRRTIRDLRIKSILNLRGGTEYDPWYVTEVHSTHALNVDLLEVPMFANRRPSRRELTALVDLFAACRYPILIHCKWGSDRTGLASAVYLMTIRGVPPSEALRAFSLAHGHVPIGGPQLLHAPLEEYDAWLKAQHMAHTPEHFRRWVLYEYRDRPAEDGIDHRDGRRPLWTPSRTGGVTIRFTSRSIPGSFPLPRPIPLR